MTENELIKTHIEECEHRIKKILGFMESNEDANVDGCKENIEVLKTVVIALEEIQQYRAIGTIEEFKALKVENSELHNEVQAINATMSLFEQETRNKAIDEFSERLKYELNGNIIPDKEKFTYAVKQQEQICHQNTTLKRAIKYVEYIAEQMKGGE